MCGIKCLCVNELCAAGISWWGVAIKHTCPVSQWLQVRVRAGVNRGGLAGGGVGMGWGWGDGGWRYL